MGKKDKYKDNERDINIGDNRNRKDNERYNRIRIKNYDEDEVEDWINIVVVYKDEEYIDFVYINERGELCSDDPGGCDSDWTTPAIETTDIGNSPIINIITAYTNSIGSRRYSCVLLLSINNTAL